MEVVVTAKDFMLEEEEEEGKEAAAEAEQPSAFMREQGVAFVLWTPFIPHRDGGPDERQLTAMFGPPQRDGELRWWAME